MESWSQRETVMEWSFARAESVCGDLIQQLKNLRTDMKFERAGSQGDDGLIYFTNTAGTRTKVVLSREALRDYVDADNHDQILKEQKLANCFDQIDKQDVEEALIESQHLAI